MVEFREKKVQNLFKEKMAYNDLEIQIVITLFNFHFVLHFFTQNSTYFIDTCLSS